MGETPAPPLGYITSFTGRCFRCLGRDHKLAECRDPLRCLACHRIGHRARDCPLKRAGSCRRPIQSRLNFPKPSIQSRLTFPESAKPLIHSRIVFPPLTHQSEEDRVPQPPATDVMSSYPGMPENRPVVGNAIVVTSIAMTEEATKLRTRSVLLVARNRPHNVDINIGDVSRVVAGCV